MEKNQIPNNQLCFVTVVFPFDDDNYLLSIKKKLDAVFTDMPKVKAEYKLGMVKDNGGLGQPGNMPQLHNDKL